MKTAKTRAGQTHCDASPGTVRGEEGQAQCGSEHVPATSPRTSCLRYHLFPPGLLPLNGVPWSRQLALSDTIRSAQHPAHTGPAACHSSPDPVFLTGPPAPNMTLHLSGGPFFTGHLLLWQIRAGVNPTYDRLSEAKPAEGCCWLPAECGSVELGSIPNCILARLWTVPGPTVIAPNCSSATGKQMQTPVLSFSRSWASPGGSDTEQRLLRGNAGPGSGTQGPKTACCYQVLSS